MRAETASGPPLSRTTPIKLATPPMPWSPLAIRSSSIPTSKSSRCTRIIALASGHRREQRDLVAVADPVVAPDIFLVDRDADDRQVLQCLGVTAAAPAQPFEKPLDVAHVGRQRQLLLG